MVSTKLLNLLAPPNCLRCSVEGHVLCPDCLASAFEVIPSRCFLCKQLTDDFKVCRQCKKQTPLQSVYVGTAYSGPAKQLVNELKFVPNRAAATVMAQWLDEVMSYVDSDFVTFVPTARTRVRQRGFDHARLLSKHFAEKRSLPWTTLLVRHGSSRQVGAEKQTRAKQIAGAYTAKKRLHGEHILLIDDISTTGATLSEAAKILKQNGAGSVSAM